MRKQELVLRGEPQRESLIRWAQAVKLDKPIRVTIEAYRKGRSLSQLGLLWKRHGEIAEAVSDTTGYSAEEVHELFKRMFLKPKIIEVEGRTFKHYSTKELTAGEMSEFMNKIEAFAISELGLILTNPDDQMAR